VVQASAWGASLEYRAVTQAESIGPDLRRTPSADKHVLVGEPIVRDAVRPNVALQLTSANCCGSIAVSAIRMLPRASGCRIFSRPLAAELKR